MTAPAPPSPLGPFLIQIRAIRRIRCPPILTTVGGNDTLPVAKGIGYVMGYDEAVRAQSTTAAIAFLKRHLLR